MAMKVYMMIADEDNAARLYEAARNTFALPPLIAFDNEGMMDEFHRQWDPTGVYQGPDILHPVFNGLVTLIMTESKGRLIQLDWANQYTPAGISGKILKRVCIVFQTSSTRAAGEIIAHLREFAGEARIITDEGVFGVNDYPGPVHPDLGMSAWDYDWVVEHPKFLGIADPEVVEWSQRHPRS